MIDNGILFLDEVNSTNTYLKSLLEKQLDLSEGTMVCSDLQTSGHGQVGNSWESERGANLIFSILLYPHSILPSEQFYISQAISLGIVDFLTSYCQLEDISIKWPNDIYWKNKKICGILIEHFISGHLIENTIAGIGININQKVFKSNAPNPVSVYLINGKTYDIKDAASVVWRFVFSRYLQLLENKRELIRTDYFSLLYRKEGFHKYSDENGIFSAKIIDVQETGVLVLLTDKGEKRKYAFKEVEYQLEN